MATNNTTRQTRKKAAKATNPASGKNASSEGRARSPIDLSIAGNDLLLSGRFHRWQAAAITDSDLDHLSVRMAVDATSPDHLAEIYATGPSTASLLSFRSRHVERLQPLVYRAAGELTSSAGKHPLEMVVEMPDGHTSFFALSFTARKADLGDAWAELVTGGSGAGGIDAERRLDPRAGVRDPILAAA